MISLDELCAVLDGLGIEWANERFGDGMEPKPPYICLSAGFEDVAFADNAAYARWMPYEILLYTRTRDYDTERTIGDALDAAGCIYTKAVTNVDGEHLIEVAFSVNVEE